MSQPTYRQAGFSLIELMITIVVVGVLGTLAAPSMLDFIDKRRLVSQAEAIAELFQFARSEAIKHSSDATPKTVTVTLSPSSPWFLGLSNTGTTPCTNDSTTPCSINQAGAAITRVVTATECTACTLTLTDSDGAAVTSAVAMVIDLRGVVASGAGHFVNLQSARGKELQVSMSPIGRVALCTSSSPSASVPGYPSCS